jgi:hypothetical protein
MKKRVSDKARVRKPTAEEGTLIRRDATYIVSKSRKGKPKFEAYPALALRDCRVFAGEIKLLYVGREKSRKAIAEAIGEWVNLSRRAAEPR